MNAGAYGSSIGKLVREVTTIDLRGEYRVRSCEELNFAYRWSNFQEEEVIILEECSSNSRRQERNSWSDTAILNDRLAKHPHHPVPGVFRNPAENRQVKSSNKWAPRVWPLVMLRFPYSMVILL